MMAVNVDEESLAKDELAQLHERISKLSWDKSYLQLIINLMNKVNAAQGLDNMVETLLSNILYVIGGTNIILYYRIDSDHYYADLMGKKMKLDQIDDDLVRKTFESGEPLEIEHDFGDTHMLPPEFTKAYTWVFPLQSGSELIGVIKLENLHIDMREFYGMLSTLFTYVATVLKNEIFSHTRLKQAYDQLQKTNEQLQQEAAEKEQVEDELRLSRDELEKRVQIRAEELQQANERLQQELEQHKRTQEELRKFTAEIQDLYDHAPCGYHSLDSSGTFIRINDTELRWLGYPPDEIIRKKRFSDLVTEQSQQTFHENFPRFLKQGWVNDLEFEMVRKDGSILPVLLSATAVYDDNGNFLMSRSTVYDITERRKMEEKEHLLSAIVQSSDDAILAKDIDGNILSWNHGAERIYGYYAEEIIGRSIAILSPPGQEDELAGIMAEIRLGNRIEHFVTTRQRKDGQLISVSLTVSPIKDLSGAILGASSIARDITGQIQSDAEILRLNRELEKRVESRTNDLKVKRTELEESQRALMNIVEDLNLKTAELESANAKLLELDRLKSMFIASMSHELRTPLNSIIGFSSILRDEWLGPVNPEQKENLDTIQRSGKHLLSLINDVIDVSKIEAGKIEVHIEEFDLYDLLVEAVQYVERDLRDKQLELHLDIHHCQLCTDKRRLLQCVINLLSNAVKFTEHGEVTVLSAPGMPGPGGYKPAGMSSPVVVISIKDTGIGIAEKDAPRLFKPFVRLDTPLKTTVTGTGLGLYLTRKLVVDVLHGDIVFNSVAGVGSCFSLTIPEHFYEKSTGS
jgi:PAS domain S-box-containing protein